MSCSPKLNGNGKHKFKSTLFNSMIKKGSEVRWKWGNGFAKGTVAETFDHEITQEIKGAKVTRKGKQGDKALFIQQNDGDHVLKSESEVERL